MNFLFASLFSVLSYSILSRFIKGLFKLDCIKPTPAISRYDRVDFVPTKPLILFGSHLSAILGIGAVLGSSFSLRFGESPVFWILLLGIILAFARDFLSAYVSLHNEGESLIELSKRFIGRFSWVLLLAIVVLSFSFFALIYLWIIPYSLTLSEKASSAFIYMLFFSFLSSILIRVIPVPQGIASLLAIVWITASSIIAQYIHFHIDQKILALIILGYSFASLILPVWISPQSFGFISSFLSIPLLALGGWGLISGGTQAIVPFELKIEDFSPLIFVYLGCLGFSGFHALLTSSLSSKHMSSECHILPVCWGSLIIELLVILIVIKAVLIGYSLQQQNVILAFVNGFAELSNNPYIPKDSLRDFAILFFSAISITSFASLPRSIYYALPGRDEGRYRKIAYKTLFFISILGIPSLLYIWLFRGDYSFSAIEKIWTLFGIYNLSIFVGISGVILGWMMRTRKNYIFYSIIVVALLGIFILANLSQLKEFMLAKDSVMLLFLIFPFVSVLFILSVVVANYIASYYEEKVR